jgi:hypothetical protein
VDPTVPDVAPTWPGALGWRPPNADALASYVADDGTVSHELPVELAVADEIRARGLAQVRGEHVVDAADAHRDLLRLKVSALLALLDDRLSVTADDWRLAGMVVETSTAVRQDTEVKVAAVAASRERATSTRMARRHVQAVNAADVDQVEKTVARIVSIVTEHDPKEVSVRAVTRRLSKRQAEVFAEALDLALERKAVIESHEPGQGTDKRVLRLAPRRR